MNDEAKQASLGCFRATFTPQYSLYCHAKEPLFHTNNGSVGVEKRLFLYIMGATSQQNTIKTAIQNSIINFYFVTTFYSLYDICMADKKTFFRQEDMKTCFLGKKAYAESLPLFLVQILLKEQLPAYTLYIISLNLFNVKT